MDDHAKEEQRELRGALYGGAAAVYGGAAAVYGGSAVLFMEATEVFLEAMESHNGGEADAQWRAAAD
eukprot:2142169-Rhodomonas_salina.1